jgi:hypothetical protein
VDKLEAKIQELERTKQQSQAVLQVLEGNVDVVRRALDLVQQLNAIDREIADLKELQPETEVEAA